MGPCLSEVLQHARELVARWAKQTSWETQDEFAQRQREDALRLATLTRYEQRFTQTVATLQHQASGSVPTMDTKLPAMTDFVDEHLMTSCVPVL